MSTISRDDFARVDIRLGTIVEAAPLAEARKPAFRPVVDFGPAIGPFMSEVLVLGCPDADGEVCLVTVDPAAPNGDKLF